MTSQQRQVLSIEVMAGTETVSRLAREHHVSRKFVYHQVQTAEQALQHAFSPASVPDEVLFHLPVTKSWLQQLVLSLVLTCHSSYRGVVDLLGDLLDTPISLGTVHNIVHGAVAQARRMNQQYEFSQIQIGAHDEIYQAGVPVLVGVDTASTFCYLLSAEEHCDGDTWGVRLLELVDRGFAPQATVGDGGRALRCGQEQALPAVTCRGDHFHILRSFKAVVTYLENRAYDAMAVCQRRECELDRQQRRGKPAHGQANRLRVARQACTTAVQLSDDVSLLLGWLRQDIFAVAGPPCQERYVLYDFVIAELQSRVCLCQHRLEPLCRLLRNGQDDFLAFAQQLDKDLDRLAAEFCCPAGLLRDTLTMLSWSPGDPKRWKAGMLLRSQLRGRFHEICEAVGELRSQVVRASSLVENLNSRLRAYFFLRRHLGTDYLSLLQFFMNHRRFDRSDRPERVGKSPAELLTGVPYPHWLTLLGFTRFQRA